jgi:hypothetical protein
MNSLTLKHPTKSERSALKGTAAKRSSLTKLGRPTDRQDAIVQRLRGEIINGQWMPGSRLPLRTEIEEKYGASPLTVQRALDALRRDGFVHPKGRLGTFVVENPPHLSRYALIFPAHPFDTEHWRHFWTALSNEAMSVAARDERELPIYHGVLGHTDWPEYLKLVEEVRAHRLAGLIFATHPTTFLNTPLLDDPDLPRVAITGRTDLPGVQAIQLDGRTLLDMALDHFQSVGRKRVALLGHPGFRGVMHEYFLQGLKKRGLETRPYWVQTVEITSPEAARASAHLLAHSRRVESFDALLIADDHLAEPALTGLFEGGVREPEDIEIVAHGNFPLAAGGVLLARRIGFDARDVMRVCVDVIDRLRRGETVPELSRVAPVWEEEVTQ